MARNKEGSLVLEAPSKSSEPKDKHSLTHLQIRQIAKSQRLIIIAFFNSWSGSFTMEMIAQHTGIRRSTVCWRLASLRKSGFIVVDRIGICPISKHPKVQFFKRKGA